MKTQTELQIHWKYPFEKHYQYQAQQSSSIMFSKDAVNINVFIGKIESEYILSIPTLIVH